MATANQVSQLFVALYNRAIDATTAQKYAGQAYNAQLVNNIIADNGGVTETGRAFIERLYKNALGKTPSDDLDGITYWTNQAEGKVFNETTGTHEATASQQPWSRGDTVLRFLSSVNAWSTDGAMTRPAYMDESQWATHSALARAGADVFGAKVAVSNQAATRVGGDAGAANLTFDGAGGLENITKDNYKTAVENNLAKLEGLALRYPAKLSGGNDITLGGTQASALPTVPEGSSAGAYKVTTAFDDNIYASIPQSGAAAAPTLQTSTQIEAGAGYDTLYVDMGNSFEGLSGAGKITGVEKIVLTNTTHNENISFNALGIKDVYTYSIKGSNGINLQNIDYNEYLLIELDGVANTMPVSGGSTQTGGTTSLTFNNRPAGGNLNLSLKNVGAASDDTGRNNHTVQFGIGSGSYIGGADGSVLSGIQMLNLAVSGKNYVDIANSGVTRITVTGTGDLDTNLSSGVNYFNAAAAAGNLIVRATDPKTGGNNATGVFDYFSTGEGNDKVVLDVSRLAQNAVVDLGADKYDPTTGNGGDTLTLVGQVDNVARTNTYNFNTIEHLVFGTTTKNPGDSLLINLGTVTENQKVGEEDVLQPDGTTTKQDVFADVQVADRSADLKTITFQDAANVRLTGLGDKNLSVIYNGATDGQDVLVDTKGTVNLTLNGADTDLKDNTTGDANGKLGQGIVNLSNAKTVNLDLTGQGFEGFLKFDNATTLNITNYTGDKKLKLKPNEINGNSNHLSSVETLTIDTTAKGDNASSQALDDSVDLRAATLPSLTNAKLIGVGGIQFGDIDTRNALTFDGSQYSGRLLLGNVSAKPNVNGIAGIYGENAGVLNITTKGAITTGTLSGQDITIKLNGQIESADGLFNNNIGDIVLIGNTEGKASLSYATGFSGTVYQEKGAADLGGLNVQPNTIKDTQTINITSREATITLDGTTGTDKFLITAGQDTKTITLSGSLGAANPTQIASKDYDKLTIDLSGANGVTLSTDVVIDSRDGAQAIEIIASKGKDVISLSNSTVETISLSVGGGRSGVNESYTVDLGSLKLEQGETFTIDGLTVVALADLTANQIADGIKAWVAGKGAFVDPNGAGKIESAGGTPSNVDPTTVMAITGNFNSLTGAWSGAKVEHATAATTFVINSGKQSNIADLNMTWGANTQHSPVTSNAIAHQQITQAYGDVLDNAGTAWTSADLVAADIADGSLSVFAFSFGDQTIEIGIKASGGDVNATAAATYITNLLNGSSGGTLADAIVYYGGNTYTGTTTTTVANLKLSETLDLGNFAITNPADKKIGVSVVNPLIYAEDQEFSFVINGTATILTLAGRKDAADAKVEVTFDDLMAGHSYTFNGKTVVATKDLTGAEVANIFGNKSVGDNVNGAVVVSDWEATQIVAAKIATSIEGNTLTITDATGQAGQGILAPVSSTLTTTQPSLIDTNGIKATTTNGVSADPTVPADSYVTFNSKTLTGVAANQNFIDEISNFDTNVDRLSISKFDGSLFTSSEVQTNGNLSLASGDGFEDAAGGALVANVAGGIVNFAWTNADAEGAGAITLDQKLYVATHITGATNKIVGFYHSDNTTTDFYVVALGGNASSTTDDLVIKLNGVTAGAVSNVTDIMA